MALRLSRRLVLMVKQQQGTITDGQAADLMDLVRATDAELAPALTN